MESRPGAEQWDRRRFSFGPPTNSSKPIVLFAEACRFSVSLTGARRILSTTSEDHTKVHVQEETVSRQVFSDMFGVGGTGLQVVSPRIQIPKWAQLPFDFLI